MGVQKNNLLNPQNSIEDDEQAVAPVKTIEVRTYFISKEFELLTIFWKFI